MFVTNAFFGEKENQKSEAGITVTPIQNSVVLGNLAEFNIKNNLDIPAKFTSPCETAGSLEVYRLVNNKEVTVSSFEDCKGKQVSGFELAPGEETKFSLSDFNMDVYSESGRYQMKFKFDANGEEKEIISDVVEFENPGLFRKLFRGIISKPLFNLLVIFSNALPGHSFGWAIVLLTILVRLLLFIPNQKAIFSQHELQKFQPKIEELRQKYKDNQQLLAMKTMELYKTHKINPMGSCLPMLLQMPFLIGIYFVVRDGFSSHLNYLLWEMNKSVDLSIVDSQFFGMDLGALPFWWGLPILVGITQFGAMKLTFAATAKKKTKSNAAPAEGMAAQMEQMQKMMLYMMPIMIGFFTATFPAAVGVYWFTSTLFGIGQQKLLYMQLDKKEVVRVREKN